MMCKMNQQQRTRAKGLGQPLLLMVSSKTASMCRIRHVRSSHQDKVLKRNELNGLAVTTRTLYAPLLIRSRVGKSQLNRHKRINALLCHGLQIA
jgi:hypothetical protein